MGTSNGQKLAEYDHMQPVIAIDKMCAIFHPSNWKSVTPPSLSETLDDPVTQAYLLNPRITAANRNPK